MPTQFLTDMSNMVEESTVTVSKKNLARTFVRDVSKLANGSRGSVEAICDALVAQTPILLEMYLADVPTHQAVKEIVSSAVNAHIKDCPLKISELHSTMRQRKSDSGETDWKRIGISALMKLGWPGASVGLAYYVVEALRLFLGKS